MPTHTRAIKKIRLSQHALGLILLSEISPEDSTELLIQLTYRLCMDNPDIPYQFIRDFVINDFQNMNLELEF